MNEDSIKAEMRLWALEMLTCNLFVMPCALDPSPNDLFQRIQQQMIDGARRRTFEEVDPAMSDLFSAELEAAVTRLMDMGSAQIRAGLRRPTKP